MFCTPLENEMVYLQGFSIYILYFLSLSVPSLRTWTRFRLKARGLLRALRMVIGHHSELCFYILTWNCSCLSICILHFFFTERNRRSGRQHPMSTRRMVALYDYDPRESSPNVDVEVPSPRSSSFPLCFNHCVSQADCSQRRESR